MAAWIHVKPLCASETSLAALATGRACQGQCEKLKYGKGKTPVKPVLPIRPVFPVRPACMGTNQLYPEDIHATSEA